jgi:hypothetical protein
MHFTQALPFVPLYVWDDHYYVMLDAELLLLFISRFVPHV